MAPKDGLRPTIATERFSCRIDAELGTYSIYNIRRNLFTIESSKMAIVPPQASGSPPLYFGEAFCLNADESVIEPSRVVLHYAHQTFPFKAAAEFATDSDDPNSLTVRLSFTNSSDRPIQIYGFYPLYLNPSDDASIDLGGSWNHASMLINAEDSTGDSKIEFFSKPDGTVYESHGYTVLYNRVSEQDLLVGFETVQSQFGRILVSPRTDGIFVQAFSQTDNMTVRPGETIQAESLLIRVSDHPRAQLDTYTKRVCKASQLTPTRTDGLSGWTSCGLAGSELVSESDILRNLEWFEANKTVMPIDHILINDGWQTKIGDWLTQDEERFPTGLAGLATKITAAGFKPGLCIAPFLAHPQSEFFDQHRGWFLKDNMGALVKFRDKSVPSECYVLDCTHPDALAWLEATIRTICSEWGFVDLHLDHLYTAAHGGMYKDSHATRAVAYRQVLEAIRSGAGESVTISVAGAAFTASAGLVDFWRTGPEPNSPSQIVDDGAIKAAGRSNLLRSPARGRWWRTDTGPISFSNDGFDEGSDLLLDTIAAVCSDSRFMRGEMADYSQDDLDRARFIIGGPNPDEAFVPNLLERDMLPNCYVTKYGDRSLVALFDWEDGDEQITLKLTHLGAEAWDAFVVYDVWLQQFDSSNVQKEYIARNVHRHSCRLLNFVPLPKHDTPVLIGSSFHFSQGAAEILSWNREGKSLAVEIDSKRWVGRSGSITLFRRGPSPVALSGAAGATEVMLTSEAVDGGQSIKIDFGSITGPIIAISLIV